MKMEHGFNRMFRFIDLSKKTGIKTKIALYVFMSTGLFFCELLRVEECSSACWSSQFFLMEVNVMPELIREWSDFMYQKVLNTQTWEWEEIPIFVVVEVKK
jgi:hypothetical protein